MTNDKKLKLAILTIIFMMICLTMANAQSRRNIPGKKYIEREQRWYNYQAVMKRNESFTLQSAREDYKVLKQKNRENKRRAKELSKINELYRKMDEIR